MAPLYLYTYKCIHKMYIVKLIKIFNLNIKYMYIIYIFLNDFLK